jgi:hypothetical protein
MRIITRTGLALSLAFALGVFAAGCGPKPGEGDGKADGSKKNDKGGKDTADRKDSGGEATTHEGWWCDEHGIPEAECIMCSEKLKKEAKEKDDWCKHNRARSQCFVCTPRLKEVYAERYREKFGKEPPPPTDND